MLTDDLINDIICSMMGHDNIPDDMIAQYRNFRTVRGLISHLSRLPNYLDKISARKDHAPQIEVNPNRSVVVFQHIPKCGGTSIHKLLEAQLGPAFPERHNGLGNWSASKLSESSFFSGHFDSPTLALIPPCEMRIITALRSPDARLISMYRYLRSIRPETAIVEKRNMGLATLARKLSPEEFFNDPQVAKHPSIFNSMTRQLSEPLSQKYWESLMPTNDSRSLVSSDPDLALLKAKKNLESMVGIILIDKLPETLPLVLKALALNPTLEMPLENSYKSNLMRHQWFEPAPEVEITTGLKIAINNKIELDWKLYDYASHIIKNKIKAR